MALSQKHFGKILTPWFNRAEWELVYNLIYNGDINNKRNDLKKAHQITLIWKARSPTLCAGADATSIILGAILQDSAVQSIEDIQVFRASAVMRFLNVICATDNNKQHTIFHLARKKNIPDWIIAIRHDFAHRQGLMSFCLLQSAIDFCLDWLKTNYWETELRNLTDCEVSEHFDFKDAVNNLLRIYQFIAFNEIKFNQNLSFDKVQIDFQNLISSTIYAALKIKPNKRSLILDSLDDYCIHVLDQVNLFNVDKFINHVSVGLINLLDNHKVTYNKQILIKYPKRFQTFVKLLNPLLIELERREMLSTLMQVLIKNALIIDVNEFESLIASMWLREIFNSLLFYYLKLENVNEDINSATDNSYKINDSIKFNLTSGFSKYNFKNFTRTAMFAPNENVLIFGYPLLRLSGYCNQASLDQIGLISAYCSCENKLLADAHIYDSMELVNQLPDDVKERFMLKTPRSINVEHAHAVAKSSDQSKINSNMSTGGVKRPSVHRVKDPLMFMGYPLGLLPGQESSINPLLNVV